MLITIFEQFNNKNILIIETIGTKSVQGMYCIYITVVDHYLVNREFHTSI